MFPPCDSVQPAHRSNSVHQFVILKSASLNSHTVRHLLDTKTGSDLPLYAGPLSLSCFVPAMSQVNNDPTMCDYCHQRPRFLPYDYCSKTCGSLATKGRNQGGGNPVNCKQCGQRPVYQNHQFCGKKCANAWAVAQGQINTLGYFGSWYLPWNQAHQGAQGGGQQGQGRRGIQGYVRGLLSPASQSQQQQMSVHPAQLQQAPNNTANLISNMGAITTPSPMLPATPNQSNNNQPGPFNGARPFSVFPTQPTSPGITTPQFLNTANPYASRATNQNVMGMGLVSRSDQSLSYASEPDDTIHGMAGQRVDPASDFGEPADGRDETAEFFVGEVDVHSIGSFPPPESVSTCMLEGCSNPTFVDSITDLESEYCSWKHQKEAIAFKQAGSCIVCHKRPRGPTDYFCSTECRTRALCQI